MLSNLFNFKNIEDVLKGGLRPELHDQVFYTIFLHQSCERLRKVYDSLLQAPVGNFISQPSENENQCPERLAEFLRGDRTELYFVSKFSKSRRCQRRKQSFYHDLENIDPQNTKKIPPKSTQRTNAS